ncbi:HAD family hydrolase [Janthinobacterium fluminis]|uniref:HAD family phosphatase n=1 Tax=Janthinobacterium fluminis TaxID=2987524 RepID=A0ABT5JV43_9BURK|nr:HAD family phosphatase [Janthinobacterium fluminis]MDC8756588.1 HAD family phosphatase [Janthinobacterium fluminis]
MNTPQLILWDLDGTLIHSESLHMESIRHACRMLGKDCGADLGIPAGSDGPSGYRHLFGMAAEQPLPDQYADWYGAAIDYVVAHLAETAPVAAAVECCAWFAGRGLAQTLVSNSHPRIIEASLRHLGIREHFTYLCSGDEVARGKPAPDAYLHALALHGAAAESCLVFEDSRNGIIAAKAAGLRVVAVSDLADVTALGDFTVSPSQPASWHTLRQRLF